MKNYQVPESELMSSGHLACQGCSATQAMRFALKALGDKTVLVMPACCWSVIDGAFPHTAVQVPLFLQDLTDVVGANGDGRVLVSVDGFIDAQRSLRVLQRPIQVPLFQ